MSTDHTGRIPIKFDIGNFYENLPRNKNLATIGQKYRAFYMKTKVGLIVSGDIKSQQKRSLRMKWYQSGTA